MNETPPDDAPPDAAWYEQQRIKARARAAGVSLPVMTAASQPAMSAAATAPVDPPAAPESVHTWQKVGRTVGDVFGSVVKKVGWQRGRVYNPKILCVNVTPAKKKTLPPENWLRDIVAAFKAKRAIGVDPSWPYFEMVMREVEKIAKDGTGYLKRAYKSLGRLAGLGRMEGHWGRETVRKSMDWARDNGWLGPMNTLYRDPETRALRRDSNVYQLFTKEDAAEISAIEDPSARALKRESLTLSRGAVLWGLMVRPWGLNATPSPSNRHQTKTRPAPA